MTETEQKASEAKSVDGEKSAPASESPGQLAGVITKSLQAAGLGAWIKSLVVSGLGAGGGIFITSLMATNLPIKMLGGLVGGFGTFGIAVVAPTIRKAKQGADVLGESLATGVEDAAKKQWIDRPFEDQYWECQALECRAAKSTGIPQYDGIFVSLLEKVFVELGLDGNAQLAGYGKNIAFEPEELVGNENCDRLQIWDLLKRAEKQPELRRIALLAWGGYGKTTLMRHVAYIYSENKQRRGLERKIPVLVILGRYRELLSGEHPPDLATFVEKHHIPDLPGGEDLTVPENWAQSVLKGGRAVVIWDGFDEIPKAMRSGLVKWMNEQTKRYPKSIFMLTSRPKSYREQDPETFAFPTAYWVQEFDDVQRRDFIDRWYLCQEVYAHGGEENAAVKQTAKRAADDLSAQIDRRQELKDMAKNPLLLTMMTTFHRRNNGVNLPRRRVELYQEICRLQLKDRPGARQLETVLLNCEAQVILQGLALAMMQAQSRLMKEPQVLEILQVMLTAKSESIAAVDFLEQVTNVGELLIRQEDEYEFAHLSFQEYLAAMEIARTQQESLLYQHLNVSGEFADSWSRLMLLYVGLVNPTNLILQAIVQSRSDLAGQMYQETTKQIDDPSLKSDLERGLKQEVKASKYAKLEALLKAGEWREADQETYRVMIQIVEKEEGQGFSRQDLETFPCEDLLSIDKLWVEASNGHFGFSVQKKIWEQCGSPTSSNNNYKKLINAVGWQDPKFSVTRSLKGELPLVGYFSKFGYGIVSFLSRHDL
jgi:predicted NACHT family NTPase